MQLFYKNLSILVFEYDTVLKVLTSFFLTDSQVFKYEETNIICTNAKLVNVGISVINTSTRMNAMLTMQLLQSARDGGQITSSFDRNRSA
jgi:hypothetical protein